MRPSPHDMGIDGDIDDAQFCAFSHACGDSGERFGGFPHHRIGSRLLSRAERGPAASVAQTAGTCRAATVWLGTLLFWVLTAGLGIASGGQAELPCSPTQVANSSRAK